jgi:hypothetical protein
METDTSSTAYELNAVIPGDLVAPLLAMLQQHGGQVLRMMTASKRHVVRRKNRSPARDIILDTLEQSGRETPRSDLQLALELNGHSPASVGPICSILQQERRVFSPRRGFWQVRG